ncbi:hypothetical protein DH86_00002934, partial [Scytalidium sp. 3C]
NKRGRRTTQKNEDGVPRKRGRPPSKPQKPMTLQLPEPKYIPFICEWQDCSAELQNLDTLRRHISVVHGKAQDSGLYSCLWGKCGKQLAQIQGGSYEALMKANEFWTEQDWREHVNEAHLIPFAWHMGDGPKGTTFDTTAKLREEQSIRWLLDSEGRQVTPSIKNQLIEEGDARENNRMRFVWKRVGVDYILVPRESDETAVS